MRTGSLRHRVIVLVLGVLFVVLLAMVILVQALFTVFSAKDVNAVLNARLVAAQQLVNKNTNPRTLARKLDTGGVRVSLVLPDGQTFGTLGANVPSNLDARSVTLSKGSLAGARLTLAVDEAAVTSASTRLRRLLELTALGALVVTGVALLFTVRLALSPLDAMTNLARSIARGGRGRRLWPTKPHTELGRTAAAFDDMLDALEGAEAAANRAEQAATEAAERTRRFVADAAHELRTPIAGVQAVAEAVLQQPPDADPEEVQRLQLLLVRESRRASQLVDDLLDLARIDSGVELHKENLDLRVLAEAQIDRIRLLAPELTLTVEGPSLPVYADPARVTQILANLLDNAKQATPPDGSITVRLGYAGNFAEVMVIDSGHGVPATDRERIFDRLVRLDRARDRRSGGSGLGLAIARGFARAHGGELTCEPPVVGSPGASEPPVARPTGASEHPVVGAGGAYEPAVVSERGAYQPPVASSDGAPSLSVASPDENCQPTVVSSPGSRKPPVDRESSVHQPAVVGGPGAVFRLLLPLGDISVAPTERFNPRTRVGFQSVDRTRPNWPGGGR